jgi:hypothetical protein
MSKQTSQKSEKKARKSSSEQITIGIDLETFGAITASLMTMRR